MLQKIGVKYLVAKKTLLRKALEALSFEVPSGGVPKLDGEIAVVFSESESLEAIKAVQKFAQSNKMLKLTAGIFESKYIDGEKVLALADIPSIEILLGQLINIINSPVRGLVVTLSGIAKK